MMQINLSEVRADLPMLAAAAARVTNTMLDDLVKDLLEVMTPSEQEIFRKMYKTLRFSEAGKDCPL